MKTSKTTHPITFVTAFMDIYDDNPEMGAGAGTRSRQWRLEKFVQIAETGIPLCVYVDAAGHDLLEQCSELFANVQICRVMEWQDTWIHRVCEQYMDSITLPPQRDVKKDTYAYMVLMHSKIEFLAETVRRDPWGSTHVAWIDFNVAHIFQEVAACQRQLRALSQTPLSWRGILFPGCWDPCPKDQWAKVLDAIHWRFCGGFFLGDCESVRTMHALYQTMFPEFMFQHRRMVWEVNFWAWLEATVDTWKPTWYLADHNDSMFQLPSHVTCCCLSQDAASFKSVQYNYPVLDGFFPMSASVCPAMDGTGRWIMNTRYVNYRLTPQGSYIFYHPDKVIVTRNWCHFLQRRGDQWMPGMDEGFEMANPGDLATYPGLFEGVEDIRVWPEDGTLRFLGSTIQYVASGCSRIMMGTYDVCGRRLCDAAVIEPPTATRCEKNWCPIVAWEGTTPFIYQWSPMKIGTVHPRDRVLNIASTPVICATEADPLLRRLRGSTYFRPSVQYPGHWIGVAHYSEKDWPRNYFHVLVLLEPGTWRPCRYTPPFTFMGRNEIEFCIGFMEDDAVGKYHFWISQFDRDPRVITVDMDALTFLHP